MDKYTTFFANIKKITKTAPKPVISDHGKDWDEVGKKTVYVRL